MHIIEEIKCKALGWNEIRMYTNHNKVNERSNMHICLGCEYRFYYIYLLRLA